MDEIKAPSMEFSAMDPRVFLAGGITGCPNWQAEAVELLADQPGTVFNPRRDDFDVNDPRAAPEQIRWEFERLREASRILFWFPRESICPIALYELGAWAVSDKWLSIGTHIDYPRRFDVIEQIRLIDPDLLIFTSLEHTVLGLTYKGFQGHG